MLFVADVARAAAFHTSLADGGPIHVDVELTGYRLGLASVASTRDDHGLHPVAEGQRAAVVLWTDDVRASPSARSAVIIGEWLSDTPMRAAIRR